MRYILTILLVIVSGILYADLTGSIRIEIDHEYEAVGDVGITRDRVNTAMVGDYSYGTYQGTISEFYHGGGTIASGGSAVLGLVGSLTNAIGETVTFAQVKGVAIQNTSATATIKIESGLWNAAATSAVILPPYCSIGNVGSYSVGVDADRITITNQSSATATYRVWIVGN